MGKRGSAITDILPWLIIAVVLLVILMFALGIFKGTGTNFITQIKNIFRGG